MDAKSIGPTPGEPVRRRPTPSLRACGELRLPIAGPYRPRARLYRLPSGELRWLVRLWEVDRPVARLVPTETLLRFAKANDLPELARTLAALVAAAEAGDPDGRR